MVSQKQRSNVGCEFSGCQRIFHVFQSSEKHIYGCIWLAKYDFPLGGSTVELQAVELVSRTIIPIENKKNIAKLLLCDTVSEW